MNNSNYENKYLKYKNKYIELKKNEEQLINEGGGKKGIIKSVSKLSKDKMLNVKDQLKEKVRDKVQEKIQEKVISSDKCDCCDKCEKKGCIIS